MKTLWQHICDQARGMADAALAEVETLHDWTAIRQQRYREFMQSIGLDPLPERCDLKLSDCGSFSGEEFTARRIGFQIMPDCWSSACLYYPDPLPADRAPAVLYVCGHAAIGTWHYQHHPMYWARRGYVCLILDTVEQNDNPGEHHSYALDRMDSVVSLGYTPTGGEVWNAMRALDVLSADECVDPERLAVTGQSGGGVCSFHTAIADDRVKAVSTLCGISTPVDALVNEHLNGHCECMYFYNLYGRDTSEFAALIAPRPLVFCFADDDALYNPEETTALVERTRKVYRLYGQEERCRLVTCPGPHGNHPPFDVATRECFDACVAGGPRPEIEMGTPELSESVTSVFNGAPPAPNRVHLLPELMAVRGTVPLPRSPHEWPDIRRRALDALPIGLRERTAESTIGQVGEWKSDGSTRRLHRGQIEGVDVRLETVVPDKCTAVLLSVANEGENHRHAFAAAGPAVDRHTTAIAAFMPRVATGVVAAPPPKDAAGGSWVPSMAKILYRGMLLTGTTPVMMTVHDLAAAVDYLQAREELEGRRLYLYGRGDGGVAALYCSLLDDRVAGVIVEAPVNSHADGSPVLGILRVMDIPHALGLMAPRSVVLVNPGHRNWTWPARVYERLGCPGRFTIAGHLREARRAVPA